MTAQAITGGPPPDGLWERIQRFVKANDPTTWRGTLLYTLFGLAIGWVLGSR